ncbi:MAG: hypothetical protein J6W10_04160 [Kiritimatiellae bacterium]|nr:hypothetical protein [Kiritimatiellia bacterium]
MSVKTIGLDEWPEELKKAIKAIVDAYDEIVQKAKEFAELAVDRTEIEKKIEREERSEAALLAGQRAAARAKAYGLRMQLEKARRALRRRKRLHADGGLPDW